MPSSIFSSWSFSRPSSCVSKVCACLFIMEEEEGGGLSFLPSLLSFVFVLCRICQSVVDGVLRVLFSHLVFFFSEFLEAGGRFFEVCTQIPV